MTKQRAGALLTVLAAALLVLTLGHDFLKGEGGLTLGPRSVPALIIELIILTVGVSLWTSQPALPTEDKPDEDAGPPAKNG